MNTSGSLGVGHELLLDEARIDAGEADGRDRRTEIDRHDPRATRIRCRNLGRRPRRA